MNGKRAITFFLTLIINNAWVLAENPNLAFSSILKTSRLESSQRPPSSQSPYLPFTAEDLHVRFWYPTQGWILLPVTGSAVAVVTDQSGDTFSILHKTLNLPLNLEALGNDFIAIEDEVLKEDFPNVQILSAKPARFQNLGAIDFQYTYKSDLGQQSGREIVAVRGKELLRIRTTVLQTSPSNIEALLNWMVQNFSFLDTPASLPKNPTPMPGQMPVSTAAVMPSSASSASSPGTDTHDVQSLYRQGRAAYLTFSLEGTKRAIQLFQKARSVNPRFALAYAGQSEALSWQVVLLRTHLIPETSGDAEAALDLALKAAKLRRKDVAVERSLAWAYSLNGAEKNARKALKHAREMDSVNAETNLVAAAMRLDDPEQLLKNSQAALGLNPTLVGALYLQGIAQLRLKSEAEALESFNRVTRLSPHFAEAYFEKGEILAGMNRIEEAISNLQEAVAANDKLVAAHFKLAVLLEHQKRFDEAIQQYNATIQSDPQLPQPYYNLGVLFAEKKKDPTRAGVYFKKFLKRTHDSSKAEEVMQWLQLHSQ